MLGIGLGAFVDGFAKGYGIRQAEKDRDEDRAWRETQRGWAEEDRAFQAEDRAFQRSERDRAVGNRQAIEDINTDLREDFNEGVESGEFKATEFDSFWKQYGLPRMQDELLRQGDIDGAKKLMDWGESEAALKGGRLFAQSMFLAQSGQSAEALDRVIEAGKVRGYIGDDFDIDEKEEIRDETGALLGYRITIRDSDGNETQQDIATEDIPTVIATFANPQAAWESQQAAAVKKSEREAALEDYETKAEIDARHDNGGAANRTAAIKALRDRIKVDPMVDGSVNFDDLPREEREKMISEEISFAKGSPTAPAGRMVVDSNSGQPVPMPSPTDAQQAPGLGGVPKASQPASWSAPPGKGVGLSAPPAASNSTQSDLPVPSTGQIVERAAQEMLGGGDPNKIAQSLRAAGVDQSQWPAELTRVLGQ